MAASLATAAVEWRRGVLRDIQAGAQEAWRRGASASSEAVGRQGLEPPEWSVNPAGLAGVEAAAMAVRLAEVPAARPAA